MLLSYINVCISVQRKRDLERSLYLISAKLANCSSKGNNKHKIKHENNNFSTFFRTLVFLIKHSKGH